MNTNRAGYKQTEVGVIPEDWEFKPLGTFVALRRGHDLTERDRRPGEVPVMGSAGPNGFHDTALVHGPGVVLGRSGASFGQAHYCKADFWPHNTALYVTDFFGNDPLFTFYFLKAIDFSHHNSGGAQQSLNRNFIAPILVAVPKRKEQEAIAEALSDADALIESLEQLLIKKRQLKQGTMQELLTGKKRLPGFSGEWEVKSLEEVAIANWGNTATTKDAYREAGFQAYSASGPDGFVDWYEHDEPAVVLSAIGAQCGKTWLATGKWTSIKNTIWFRALEGKADTRFLYWITGDPSFWPNRGQAQPFVALGDVRSAKVPLPLPAEQTAIAAILSDIDAEIAALEAKLAKARQLKQGMMQELLTGKTRLVDSGKLIVKNEGKELGAESGE